MQSTLRTILRSAALVLLALTLTTGVPAQFDGGGGGGPGGSTGGPGGSQGGGQDGGGGQGGNPRLASDALIQYDPETDSIIVITDDETNDQISKVLETMDRPIPQVLIKVLFLEVTHSNDVDLGIEGGFSYGSTGLEDTISSNFGVDGETRGGFYRILDQDLEVTMRALATVGKLEVLSRPSILSRNNELANITIGNELPFVTNSRVTDNGQTINTIEYRDIGIILEVTPHIKTNRMVEMDVATEISTLTGDTVPISDTLDAVVIAKRSAETMVEVLDGRTVVIGGLMEDNDTATINKIPLLGDIPWLGALFRRTQTKKTKTELMIFLTPYVVDGPDQLQTLSVSENNRATIPPSSFTQEQFDKFVDNLPAEGAQPKEWNRE